MTAISARALLKRYSSTVSIGPLSFDVAMGDVFTILGANGAGKTTTLGMVSTLTQPSSGTAGILGEDIIASKHTVRLMVSVLPQGNAVDPFLSVFDNLIFFGMLREYDVGSLRMRATRLLEEMELSEKKDAKVISLSGGEVRRMQIARVLLSDATVLILDEPTLGIDVKGKLKVWDLIRRSVRERGTTVLLSTTDLTEAETLSDRIAFLKQGALREPHTVAEMGRASERRKITITFQSVEESQRYRIGECQGEWISSSEVVFRIADGKTIPELVAIARTCGVIEAVNTDRLSLLDMYQLSESEGS